MSDGGGRGDWKARWRAFWRGREQPPLHVIPRPLRRSDPMQRLDWHEAPYQELIGEQCTTCHENLMADTKSIKGKCGRCDALPPAA